MLSLKVRDGDEPRCNLTLHGMFLSHTVTTRDTKKSPTPMLPPVCIMVLHHFRVGPSLHVIPKQASQE